MFYWGLLHRIENSIQRTGRSLVLAASLVVACGGGGQGDGGGEDLGCFVEVSVDGAVNHDQRREELGCLYTTGFDSDIYVSFLAFEGPFDMITLEIDAITKGEIGDFPATLTFNHEDERRFVANECEVSITTHERNEEGNDEIGLDYRFSGHGRCSSPAESVDDPTDTLTVSDFEYAAPTSWDE